MIAESKSKRSRIPDAWLPVARTIWFAVVLFALVAWAAGVSPYFEELRGSCTTEPCPGLAISPGEASTLVEMGLSPEFYAGHYVALQAFSTGVFVLLALLIFWRRSADRMGLFVSLTLVILGTFMFSEVVIARVKEFPLVVNLIFGLAIALFVFLLFTFPNGHFVPRWSWLPASLLPVPMIILVLPETQIIGTTPSSATSIFYVLMFAGLLSGLLAQIYRYRRVSGPTERQQTKWVVFGLSAAVATAIVWSLSIDLFPLPPGRTHLYFNLFGGTAIILALLSFPISFAIAILRFRLWDIDVLINRALVYGLLTAALALVYFGSVVLLQSLFRNLTGQASQLAVVASTLAIAALFSPLRRRVQDFIDRRFYRRRYDAQQVLVGFSATARDEVDIEKLSGALLGVVQETMQPERVSLWLAEE